MLGRAGVGAGQLLGDHWKDPGLDPSQGKWNTSRNFGYSLRHGGGEARRVVEIQAR